MKALLSSPLYAECGLDDFRGRCPTTTAHKLQSLMNTKMMERKRLRLVVGLEDFDINLPADDLFDLKTLRNSGVQAAEISDQVVLRIPGRPDTVLKDERSTHIDLSAIGRMMLGHLEPHEAV